MRHTAILVAVLGVFGGLFGCGGDDDGPTTLVDWVTRPVSAVERGEVITGEWTIDTSEWSEGIGKSYLLACSGAVPDCGLTGQDPIGFHAEAEIVATEEEGVFTATASIEMIEQGNWTIVAYTDAGGDHISPPTGVIVDQLAYPEGPYGYNRNYKIANLSFTGWINAAARQADDVREITMEEFFAGQDLDAKVILINVSSGD